MSFTVPLAKVGLPLLAGIAVLGTFKLAQDNGFLEMVQGPLATAHPTLPDSVLSLRTHWTGIAAIDKQASTFIEFFWACLDGKTPSLSLQAAHFMGQGTAIWVLILVEGFRVGNVWRLVSFATIIGLMIENVLMALIVPVYCVIHLVSSPTALPASSQTRAIRKASILVHPSELQVLPWSVAIGAGIPTLLVFLSEPGSVRQQTALVIRQIHPLLTAVAHLLLSIFTSPDRQINSPDQRNIIVLNQLQKVYNFATYIAVTTHIGVCTVMLLANKTPNIFAHGYPSLFHPQVVFYPPKFWQHPVIHAQSIGQGALGFFQWDELVSVTAILIWAVALNRQALAGQPYAPGFFSMLTRAVVMTVVGGPVAAAISLIRQRDAHVLGRLGVDEFKSARS